MLMKYLLLFAVVFVAYLLWREGRLRDQRDPRAKHPQQPGTPQEMVSCPVCGVHLPRADAVPGARGILYCSPEHRQRAGG
jgi:uncharacterized protein